MADLPGIGYGFYYYLLRDYRLAKHQSHCSAFYWVRVDVSDILYNRSNIRAHDDENGNA
jgi:plasmid stabilization system protein ParE